MVDTHQLVLYVRPVFGLVRTLTQRSSLDHTWSVAMFSRVNGTPSLRQAPESLDTKSNLKSSRFDRLMIHARLNCKVINDNHQHTFMGNPRSYYPQ